ncbi:lipase family protein, partial [Tenacibaculum sediminilitoris]|uniref:lipase family protein n=1 Tax=Tenacibaculum sediminilitoris TaxID=1820334 RepID=UPI0038B6671B
MKKTNLLVCIMMSVIIQTVYCQRKFQSEAEAEAKLNELYVKGTTSLRGIIKNDTDLVMKLVSVHKYDRSEDGLQWPAEVLRPGEWTAYHPTNKYTGYGVYYGVYYEAEKGGIKYPFFVGSFTPSSNLYTNKTYTSFSNVTKRSKLDYGGYTKESTNKQFKIKSDIDGGVAPFVKTTFSLFSPSSLYVSAYKVLKSEYNETTAETTSNLFTKTDHFRPMSELIISDWAKYPSSDYLTLRGHWKKGSSYFQTAENYFIANKYNNTQLVNKRFLTKVVKKTFGDYDSSALYYKSYVSQNSLGYDYPVYNESNQLGILAFNKEYSLNYIKILRYALTASFAYKINNFSDWKNQFEGFKNTDDYQVIKDIMFPNSSSFTIIEKLEDSASGLIAVAVKVPSHENLGLDEKIIIAYKGTSNQNDAIQDLKIGLKNISEKDLQWQKDAYYFAKKVILKECDCGTDIVEASKILEDKVVFTGHSLGAYTATETAVRFNINARVFSGPATKLVDSTIKLFSTTMRFSNVINFYRSG